MNALPTAEALGATEQMISARRDWRLLDIPVLGVDHTAFLGRAAGRLEEWRESEGHEVITQTLIERAVVHEYCRLLHEALGMEGTPAQERALIETWNYVSPLIRRILVDDDLSSECANKVLMTIWQDVAQVRDPGSFLAWAAMIAGRAARRYAQRYRRELPLDDLAERDAAREEQLVDAAVIDIPDQPALARLPIDPGYAIVEKEDRRDRLANYEEVIRSCLRRMRRGAEVFIALVLYEDSVTDVARRLGLTPNNLYVIRSRAQDALRRYDGLRQALGCDLVVAENDTICEPHC